MPVTIIDTLKPKNGGSFPIVEAIDVFVENYGNLAEAVSHFATDVMIEAINTVLSDKANTSDVNTAVANLQGQIDQIVISASAEAVVAPEVAAARVDADGTSYQTLKARCDADFNTLTDKISFIGEQSVNLFNPTTVINDKFYTGTTGEEVELISNSSYYCFSIKVKPNTDYTINKVSYTIYITDASGIVILTRNGGAQSLSDYTFNSGSDAVNVYISVNKNACSIEELIIVEGNTLPQTYVPYEFIFSDGATKSIKEITNVDELQEDVIDLQDELTNYEGTIGNITSNLFDKSTIINGKYYFGAVGEIPVLRDEANFYCFEINIEPQTQYTMSRISYEVHLLNSEGVIVKQKGDGNEHAPYTFNSENSVKACISVRTARTSPDNFMFVKGTELPEEYAPYGFHFSDVVEQTLIDITKARKEYHIGAGKDYETFTACIRDLKDDDTPKDIYIDSGIYDIYEEMGGEAYIRSIPEEETNWRNVCDIIPPNTNIIGIGYVELRYFPTYYTNTSSNLISPVNISNGNISMENIRVIGQNCRYTIHDDGSAANKNVTHSYKNVFCQKVSGGYSQSFGSGIGENCIMEFSNCTIISDRLAFSVHNQWYATLSKLLFTDCVILGGNNNNDVRLGSLSARDTSYPIEVTFVNCKLNTILYANEDSNPARTIPYMVTVCNSGTPTFDSSAFAENQFPPTIY